MHLEELFAEMPYAAALSKENVRTRCSTCFKTNASTPCSTGCGVLVYCDAKCRDADRPCHEYECPVMKNDDQIDAFIRLLVRIITRRKFDGGVANLSENFPKNVPNRQLSDLMSHRREIGANEERANTMMWAWKYFRRLFAGTPIMDSFENVTRTYCVMIINCFSVSGPANLKRGHDESLGLAFYLNTSRFNHACYPDLFVEFDGARLIVQFLSEATDPKEIAAERASMTQSAQKFNGLTLNYGYSHVVATDSFFPLRSHRRASLAHGYYFKCQCALCGDERNAALELHAAALECSQCAEPLIWKKNGRPPLACCVSAESKFSCQKSCRCGADKNEHDDAKTYARSLDPETGLATLEEEFAKVMKTPLSEMQAADIISSCEPVLMKARFFWHRYGNLRMCQLNERLFVSYATAIMCDLSAGKRIDRHMLKMCLETGEGVLGWCRSRPLNACYCSIMAAYSYRLARVFEISKSIDPSTNHGKRAAFWFKFAASLWELHADRNNDLVETLRRLAEDVVKPVVGAETE